MKSGLQSSRWSKAAQTCWIWVCQSSQSAQFSAKQWCVRVEDEKANRETKTFQLPMGIEREDRCMGAGLQASKLSTVP